MYFFSSNLKALEIVTVELNKPAIFFIKIELLHNRAIIYNILETIQSTNIQSFCTVYFISLNIVLITLSIQ